MHGIMEKPIFLNEQGEIEGEHPLKEDRLYEQVLEEVELLKIAGNEFSKEAIAAGELTPYFLVQL